MPNRSSSTQVLDAQVQWVECSACNKWRIISDKEMDQLPDSWVCQMNLDIERNNCEAAEELYEEENPMNKVKIAKEKSQRNRTKEDSKEARAIEVKDKSKPAATVMNATASSVSIDSKNAVKRANSNKNSKQSETSSKIQDTVHHTRTDHSSATMARVPEAKSSKEEEAIAFGTTALGKRGADPQAGAPSKANSQLNRTKHDSKEGMEVKDPSKPGVTVINATASSVSIAPNTAIKRATNNKHSKQEGTSTKVQDTKNHTGTDHSSATIPRAPEAKSSKEAEVIAFSTTAKEKKGVDTQAGHKVDTQQAYSEHASKSSSLQTTRPEVPSKSGKKSASGDETYNEEEERYETKSFDPKITRIAIGETLYKRACSLEYKVSFEKPRLKIEYVVEDTSIALHELMHIVELLDETSIANFSYYLQTENLNADILSFISFTVFSGSDNDIIGHSNDVKDGCLRVVIEFLHATDVSTLLSQLNNYSYLKCQVDVGELNTSPKRVDYCKTLIEDSKSNPTERLATLNYLIAQESVVLHFPLSTNASTFYKASSGMKQITLPIDALDENNNIIKMGAYNKTKVTKNDLDRVSGFNMLTDPVLDCFSSWIEAVYQDDTIFIATTQFFTTLTVHGIPTIDRWLKRARFNHSTMRLLFLPIHFQEEAHWSFAVIVIFLESEQTAVLLGDSLHNQGHSKPLIKSHLNKLLRHMYPTYSEPVFINPTFPVQKNNVDCGLFVMKSMLNLYRCGSKPFRDISITDVESVLSANKVFSFDQKNITAFRMEMHKLISNLSSIQIRGHVTSSTKEDATKNALEVTDEDEDQDRGSHKVSSTQNTFFQSNIQNRTLDKKRKFTSDREGTKDAKGESKAPSTKPTLSRTKKSTTHEGNTARKKVIPRPDLPNADRSKTKVVNSGFIGYDHSRRPITYNEYLSSKTANANFSNNNHTFVAIPIENVLIKTKIQELRTKLSVGEIEKVTEHGFVRGNAEIITKTTKGKGPYPIYRVIFEYTGLKELTIDQQSFLLFYGYGRDILDKERSDYLESQDNVNSDPCSRNTTMASWLYEVHKGEEKSFISEEEEKDEGKWEDVDEPIDEESVDENQDKEDRSEYAFERLIGMGVRIPYLEKGNNHRKGEETVQGITWKPNVLHPSPKEKLQKKPSTLKTDTADLFNDPIQAFLAFMPTCWFKKIVFESNKYARMKYDKEDKGFGRFKVYDQIFHKITVREIMVFHGLLLQMVLYHAKGRKYIHYWSADSKCKVAFGEYMSLKRFQQIRTTLSLNSHTGNKKDSFVKVRPILNILKTTLGAYVDLGSDVSLDEATFPSRSSYGRFAIYFNPRKPCGKFHYKAFCICCPYTNIMTKLRFATRDNTDRAKPGRMKRSLGLDENDADETEEYMESNSLASESSASSLLGSSNHSSEDEDDEAVNKIDAIVKDLCSDLKAGTTVNSDNLYTSPQTAIWLKRKRKIFLRGTVRTNRKFLPSQIFFSRNETKKQRGYRKVAVAPDDGLVAFSWLDGRPVVMISTADGTVESAGVKRKTGSKKAVIPAPECIKEYNFCMGGVDRHDGLRSKFSLHKRHTFKRWYLQIYLILFDLAITNAWLHFLLRNPHLKKNQDARANFFQTIADALISSDSDWSKLFGVTRDDEIFIEYPTENDARLMDLEIICQSPLKKKRKLDTSPEEIHTHDKVKGLITPTCFFECLPKDLAEERINPATGKERTHSGLACQVCQWELRRDVTKNVFICPTHRVRLCMVVREDKERSEKKFVCPHENLTCWQMFHSFYQDEGQRIFTSQEDDTKFCVTVKKHDLVDMRNEYKRQLIERQTGGNNSDEDNKRNGSNDRSKE